MNSIAQIIIISTVAIFIFTRFDVAKKTHAPDHDPPVPVVVIDDNGGS